MTSQAFETALNKLFGVLKLRDDKRKELYQSEIAEFCEEYLEHKSFFIRAIDRFVDGVERHKIGWSESRTSNDVEDQLEEMIQELDSVRHSVERERANSRADRLRINKTADDRENYQYFEEHYLAILTDEEVREIGALFRAISGSFQLEERKHYHELVGSLDRLKLLIRMMRKVKDNPTAEKRAGLAESLEHTLDDLVFAREAAQRGSAEISVLQDKIRRRLHRL